jgi:hypothetical protein
MPKVLEIKNIVAKNLPFKKGVTNRVHRAKIRIP